MKLIAIETSADACSAALRVDGEVCERFAVAPRGHSELILPIIDEVLAEGGVVRSGLDAVVFGRGPGSFTGVRIATGVAQGIGFALDIPVIPVSTLLVLAPGVMRTAGPQKVLAAFDARMNEVYWAECRSGGGGLMVLASPERVCDPAQVPLPDGTDWTGAGGGWQAYGDVLGDRLGDIVDRVLPDAVCHARDAADLGASRFKAGDYVTAAEALPLYLRNSVASRPGR